MKITILGARGSVPTSGAKTQVFGGSTSCVLIETDDNAIYLDAGSGIIQTPDIGDRQISILITHPHFDHLIGLPFFPYNTAPGRRIDVYGKSRSEGTIKEQLERLISPPLWPCTLSEYKADYCFHEAEARFSIGNIDVETAESRHPGSSLIYRISFDGKSIVYATDYEYAEDESSKLSDFAKGANLILLDAQYTDEEFAARKGFGHSTVKQGLRIMQDAQAKIMRFVHHDPRHTDEMLKKMEDEVKSDSVAFAREGEVIVL